MSTSYKLIRDLVEIQELSMNIMKHILEKESEIYNKSENENEIKNDQLDRNGMFKQSRKNTRDENVKKFKQLKQSKLKLLQQNENTTQVNEMDQTVDINICKDNRMDLIQKKKAYNKQYYLKNKEKCLKYQRNYNLKKKKRKKTKRNN